MTKSIEYIKKQIKDYEPMKKEFETLYSVMKDYETNVLETVKERSVSKIDIMRELWVELWSHISTMRDSISIISIYAEITQLKYKELMMEEWMDKFEAIDKSKLMYKSIFWEIDRWSAYVERVWRLYTVIQWEVKSLLWDKRAWEFMNLD